MLLRIFYWLYRKFSWLYRCAKCRCRDFFAAENIKDIKSFRAKKIRFNISGNYSGHFSLKTQCTARCSQRVAQRKENTIYNRTTANSRFSEKNKNRKNPLRLMQNGSDEPFCIKRKAINKKTTVLLETSWNSLYEDWKTAFRLQR